MAIGARVRVSGSVGVYDVDPRQQWVVPISLDRLPETSLAELEMVGSVPLYGMEAPSFPPFEAVCLYGGKAVAEWLSSMGGERTDYDQAAVTALAREYTQVYQQRCPLFSNEYAGVLGGWHAIWPDDEFYLPREMRLVLWTLWDSEPWIEVFERGPNLPVRVRTT